MKTRNGSLMLFFLITFAWSWLLWLPEVLWGIRLYLAPFGPTAAAFILTFKDEGFDGVKKLFTRGVSMNFRKVWLIPIFLLMPSIVGFSLLFAVLMGEPMPEITVLSEPLTIIPAFFYIMFLGGPVAEEFGWRGYALGRLQARFNATVSSVLIGVIWGLWHLPLFFMKGQDIYHNVPILGFVLGTVFLSILFTWIYNNTNGSILAALLFHTMGNLSHFIFPAMSTAIGGLISVILNVISVALIMVIYGPKRLSRYKEQQI